MYYVKVAELYPIQEGSVSMNKQEWQGSSTRRSRPIFCVYTTRGRVNSGFVPCVCVYMLATFSTTFSGRFFSFAKHGNGDLVGA